MSEQLPEQPMTFNSFAEWCLNKDRLSTEARHTIEVLLKCAGTSDCHEAERILSSLTKLNPSPYLHKNQISDLSPLQTLTNLTSVDLKYNQISDLSPLQTLTNLSYLHLSGNQISDLSPLQTLTNLTSVDLECNQISDPSPLQTLTNLTYLHLSGNQISDLSPLQTLTNLTYLNLIGNQISDLSPLQTLTNLTYLNLIGNQISDLSPLQTLTNLTYLDLGNNQISDLSPLQTLTNLISVDLIGNQISDPSPLQTLTNLTALYLNNNPIFELNSPLRLLRQQWQSITMSTNPIERQKATEALKSAYTLMGKAEPELVFCSNPQAAKAWWYKAKHQGSLLVQQLFQSTKMLLTPALRACLKGELQSQSEQQVTEQLLGQIQRRYPYNSSTPPDLADAISLTQFGASQLGWVLQPKEQEMLQCLKQLVEHCGWIFPFENMCGVRSPPPTSL